MIDVFDQTPDFDDLYSASGDDIKMFYDDD